MPLPKSHCYPVSSAKAHTVLGGVVWPWHGAGSKTWAILVAAPQGRYIIQRDFEEKGNGQR
jgi:hypothetical protein